MRAEKLVILTMPLMQIMMNSCIVLVMWFGGGMIARGTFAIGEFVGLHLLHHPNSYVLDDVVGGLYDAGAIPSFRDPYQRGA